MHGVGHHEVRVLFVCLGNICRSPMAEGAFRAAAGGLNGEAQAGRITSLVVIAPPRAGLRVPGERVGR